MYLITVWVAAVIMTAGSLWYCYQILREKVQPPPATFIILSSTFPFAFYMYAQNPNWSFTANIGLSAATANVWMVTLLLISKLSIQKKLRIELNSFQRITIFASLLILVFWFVTKDQFTAYILLQISALIGYIPIIKKLWRAKENPDSLVFWGSLFLSTCVASYAAYEKNDTQSWIYIIRAIPSTLIVILLMIRAERHKALR
jgi:hypothetical protein